MEITTNPLMVKSEREFMFVISVGGLTYEGKLVEKFDLESFDYSFYLEWDGAQPNLSLEEQQELNNALLAEIKISFNYDTKI